MSGRTLFAILLLAALCRIGCLTANPMVGADAARFLKAAEHFDNGDWESATSGSYHPMTSGLIAVANRALRSCGYTADDWDSRRIRLETSAHIIELIAGLVLVWAFLDTGRRLFPEVPPIALGVVVACQPYLIRSAADIMSDTIALMWFSLTLREFAKIHQSLGKAALYWCIVRAGVFTGLAYLTRPEGLVLVIAAAGWCGALFWRTPRRAIATFSIYAVVCIVLMLPYVTLASSKLGKVSVTWKKDFFSSQEKSKVDAPGPAAEQTTVASPTPDDSPPVSVEAPTPVSTELVRSESSSASTSHWIQGPLYMLDRWLGTCPDTIAVGAIIALLALLFRRRFHRGHFLFALIFVAFTGVLLRLISVTSPTYVTRRHVLLLMLLSLPLGTMGVLQVGRFLGQRIRSRAPESWGIALLAIVCMVMVVKGVRPQRNDQLAQRECAEWILAQPELGRRVDLFTNREKVSYYCDGNLHGFEASAEASIAAFSTKSRALVALYREKPRVEGLTEALAELASGDPRLTHLKTFPESKSRKPRNLELYLWRR